MRKDLAKTLRTVFAKELKVVCPQFRRRKREEIAGNRLFVWEVAPGLWSYVHLLISPYWDEFTVELAWTKHGVFPANVPPLPKNSIDDTPEGGALRLPLSYLTTPDGQPKRDDWWVLAARPPLDGTEGAWERSTPLSEALLRVDTLVQDAIQCIAEMAVPYFRRIAEREREQGAVSGRVRPSG